VVRSRRAQPGAVVMAHNKLVMDRMGVGEGEPWTYRRYAEEELYSPCGSFLTLKRTIAIVCGALDEGRRYGLESQQAYLATAMTTLEMAAKDPSHDLSWGWPLLAISDPGGKPVPAVPAAESHAVASYHREQAALLGARKTLGGASGAQGSGAGKGQESTSLSADSPEVSALVKKAVEKEMKALKGKGGKGASGKGVEE